jgi:general secretion pathway protein L
MTLQDILNADVSALGEWFGQAWRWWIGELSRIAPTNRSGRRSGGRPIAVIEREGESVRIWRRGAFVERLERNANKPLVVDLVLPPEAVLRRQIRLPALGIADLRRLVAQELDRLTPFRAEQVYFDIELTEVSEPGAARIVRLGVIPRDAAEAALDRARRFGLIPRRMAVAQDDEGLVFDFLGPIRDAGRGGRPRRSLLYWWTAVAALIAVNVAVLVWKDVQDVAALRAIVDLQQPTVSLAQALRTRNATESQARAALLARRAANEPLRVLDAVTRAFPPPQWVQRFEWNGHAVRIAGFRDPGFDVLAAIRRSKILGEPRQLGATAPALPGLKPPFDVVADPSGAPRS